MTILFLSYLSSNIAAGMSWSVPASSDAQSKIDQVMWVNMSDAHIDHWDNVECYHNYREFGEVFDLNVLPSPFNKPDIVVFEGFYDKISPKVAKVLRRKQIPYIIVPRCGLTVKAQNNHAKWKKKVANLFIFNHFAHRASSIQYLTEEERIDSGIKWNKNSFVLPNGFNTPKVRKTEVSQDCIKAVFIGRLDMYQKGIDILLDACNAIKDKLRDAKFSLCLYGPIRFNYYDIQKYIEENQLGDFITLGGETTGKEKERILLNSDLFVLTSRFEGHPMGLIEALAYGVPAIVTPGSNMAREIQHSNSGWTCESLTKDNIIKMLESVILERSSLREKSVNAMLLAEKYDWNVLARQFHDEMIKIINRTT